MYKNLVDSLVDLDCAKNTEIQFAPYFFADSGTEYAAEGFCVPAGTKGRWEISFTNQGESLDAPFSIHLCCINGSLAGKLQTTHPKRRDYAALSSVYTGWSLDVTVTGFHNVAQLLCNEGVWQTGQTVTMTIGAQDSCSEIYWTAAESFLVAELEKNEAIQTIGVFPFEVVCRNEAALVRLLLPTCACPGEAFRVVCGVYDSCGNLNTNYTGSVLLDVPEGVSGLPKVLHFLPEHRGNRIIRNVSVDREGIFRVTVGGNYLSNPLVVSRSHETGVYWGDLHVHGWGDCTMHLMHANTKKLNPTNRHLQARDLGRFDFSAVGPMSYPRIERETIWDAHRQAARDTESEGEYVPFLSYEAHPVGEDRTVIFKNTDESIPDAYDAPMITLMQTLYQRDDVLMECHIGGATPKWEKFRPMREDLVEISSAFGNAEWLLQHALSCGYRPAVCGCSDLHMGLLGGPRSVEVSRGRFQKYLNQRDSAYGTGPLTAVMAPSLTRNSLFSAMKQKNTYATDGERIYLRVSLNGMLPGTALPQRDSYVLSIQCSGTRKLSRISVISGTREIAAFSPDGFDFSTECVLSDLPSDFVYIRVMQENRSYAWTTPFYIDEPDNGWDRSDDMVFERKQEAVSYLKAVQDYLALEEDEEKFTEIEPLGIQQETLTECAVFRCIYDGNKPMLIKWYYGYEIPRIRFDWGRAYCGVWDDEVFHG